MDNKYYVKSALLKSLVFSLALVPTLSSAAVVLSGDNRSVRSSGDVHSTTRSETWNVTERAIQGQQRFTTSLDEERVAGSNRAGGAASISSLMIGNRITATSTLNSFVDLNELSSFSSSDGDASSQYSVNILLSEPTPFYLALDLGFDSIQGSPRGSAQFRLSSSFFNLTLGSSSLFADYNQSFSFSGVLDAGTYNLNVFASTDTDGFQLFEERAMADFDFDLRFGLDASPVPVPAAFWLMAGALAMLKPRTRDRT